MTIRQGLARGIGRGVLAQAALCVSLWSAAAVQAASPLPDVADARVPPALAHMAEKEGSVRLLVSLAAEPSSAKLRANEEAARMAAIAAVQQQVLDDLGMGKSDPSGREVVRYRYLPLLALRVDGSRLKQLARHGLVRAIQADEWHRPLLAESAPLVGAATAWGQGRTGSGAAVAVLDTGVDAGHPFFAGKVVDEACFSTTSTTAGRESTSLCPGGGETQFGAGAGAPCAATLGGCDHGTHVAGIAAGQGAGFSGIGRGAQIIAIQVFSRVPAARCGGATDCVLTSSSDYIQAMEHVYSQRASRLIGSVNMSLGGGRFQLHCDTSNSATKAAIDLLRSANIPTVIATGNSGYRESISSPACISTSVSVASSTEGSNGGPSDTVSSFSNIAPIADLIAPGSSINSSVPGGSFSVFNGTSMATPHVAGAFAILRAAFPNATVDALEDDLKSTGLWIVDARSDNVGTALPRIRIDAALDRLANPPTAILTVGPAAGASASGPIGGPFAPATFDYRLTNTGTTPLQWQASENVAWAGVDAASGMLVGGASATLRVQIDQTVAAALPAANHAGTLTITNATNGAGSTVRGLSLVVRPPPPANDAFAASLLVASAGASVSGSNAGASAEAGEPAHAGQTARRSVWWNWTAAANGTVVMETAGSNFDTVLGVYTGSAVGALTLVASNDDVVSGNVSSRVSFQAQQGSKYSIAVDGYNGATGTIALIVAPGGASPRPANDDFATADVLEGGSDTASTSSAGATAELGEPAHAGRAATRSLWWRWNAPAAGTATLRTAGSGFDTLLAVYTGDALGVLQPVASNDDAPGGGLQSEVSFNAVAGTVYRVAVDGYNGASGSVQLGLVGPAPPPAGDDIFGDGFEDPR